MNKKDKLPTSDMWLATITAVCVGAGIVLFFPETKGSFYLYAFSTTFGLAAISVLRFLKEN